MGLNEIYKRNINIKNRNKFASNLKHSTEQLMSYFTFKMSGMFAYEPNNKDDKND